MEASSSSCSSASKEAATPEEEEGSSASKRAATPEEEEEGSSASKGAAPLEEEGSSASKGAATPEEEEGSSASKGAGTQEEEGSSASKGAATPEEEEEDVGFESLPEELVQQVLSYLPFPQVIRARIVCRSWLEALTSPTFLILWSRRSSPSLWVLLHHRVDSSLYAFHPFSHLCLPLPSPSPSPSPSSIVASSHGILCFRCPYSVSLVNPLSRLSLSIPLPNSIAPFFHFGFTLLPLPLNRFYIIACGLSRSLPSPHAELYDSALRTWVPLHQPPLLLQPTNEISQSTQQVVWWNGKFCVLSSGRVVTYDVHASQWGSVNLPSSPRIWNSRYMTLHVIRGRLFLEGNFQRQGDFQRRFPLIVGILELDPTTLEWMEIAFMPKKFKHVLCDDAHPVHSIYTSFSDADCDHICFSPFPTANKLQLVCYHVGISSWTSMQICDRGWHYYFGSSNFKQWTFQPNFAALL